MADISRPSGGNLPHKEQTRAEFPPTTLMGKQKQAIAGLAGACNARAESVHWDGITMAQFPMPVKNARLARADQTWRIHSAYTAC